MFDDDRDYEVVRNNEDQYSIWPTGLPSRPAGRRLANPAPSLSAWSTSRKSGPTCAPAASGRRWAHEWRFPAPAE